MNHKKTIIFLLFIIALAFLYDLRISLNKGLVITDDIFASDLMNDRYPVRVELSRALKAGNLALWTPLIYNGFPLQANPESGITYPVNLILFGIFSPALAFNISILLKFLLAAIFLFLYLRAIGINHWASLFGAIAFSWCGFFVAHLKHLNMHDAGIWIPLMLLFLEKYHAQKKLFWLMLTSLILGIQILAGHPQITYYTVLLLTAYFLWQELPGNKTVKSIAKIIGVLVLFVVLGIALGMIQILPTLELTNLSERSGGVTYQFATQNPYYLPDVFTFIYPYINGDPGKAEYLAQGVFWEDYGYVGLLPLAFALYAIIATFQKNRYTRFFAGTFIISFILMLGDKGVLYKILFYVLPGLNYFRFHTRFILLVDIALAILAAIGLSKALSKRGHWLYILIIAITIIDLYSMQKRQNPVVPREQWEKLPFTAEVIKHDTGLFRIYSIGAVESHSAAYTIAKGWEGDLTPYIQQREFLQPSINMLWEISSADGYINMVPRYLITMWGNEKQFGLIQQTGRMNQDRQIIEMSPAFSNIINAFTIKYILSAWNLVNPNLQLVGNFGGILLYENITVFPRAYLVPQAIPLSDENARTVMVQGQIDSSRTVILNDSSTIQQQEFPEERDIGTVDIKQYSSNLIELSVNATHDAWLVLADTYYPGWQATIDDSESTIYRANICSRALFIKQGSHKVIFVYQPKTFRNGMIITVIALLLILVGIIITNRTSRTS
jgi:Bacterial membrane protein YfhO